MTIQTPSGLLAEKRAEVTAALAQQLAQNRYVAHFGKMSESELRAMIDSILENYSEWSGGDEHELAACLDSLENMCFVLSVPIAEAAYALYVLRDGITAL